MNRVQSILVIGISVVSVGANNHSPLQAATGPHDLTSFVGVSPRDSRYFELSNGSPYVPIGFNLVGPPREEEFERLFQTMAANQINYVRVWLGHAGWNVEHEKPLQFDSERARVIDRFMRLAHQHGIRVKMCIEYFRDIRAERNRWSDNLIYHRANGGFYESMHEYLSSRQGRDHFRAKLDWYAERYGDGPAVFAWELWNEMDAVRDSEWLDWTKEMLPELQQRFPRNLAVQSLGSYDWENKRESYRTLCLLEDNDVAQVHRYLDEGAGWPICHGPVDVLSAQAVRELIAFDADKPIILTETGAVKPRHTGCSELYAKDPDGTLLHDMLFAPFFSGAAGPGHVWWWREAIEEPNLWYHFARFAKAIEGIDPPAEAFDPMTMPHKRLRIYALSGRHTFLAWCRDAQNDWRTELVEGHRPQTLTDVKIDLSSLNLPARATVHLYDPWTDIQSRATSQDGIVTIPSLRRSVVVRVAAHATTGTASVETVAGEPGESVSEAALSEAVEWLEGEAHRIIRASKRTMADGTGAFPPQVGLGYEAFWLRDYEYTLEGAIDAYSDQELTGACRLFARHLADDGAGVDCIKFDGTPIYKPGFGTMGLNPVADGSQFTVGVAWHTWNKTRDEQLLREIIDPLVRTMHAVLRNPETGLVHIEPGENRDRCPYGFTDTIRKQGDVLFCSLLYVQACRQLSDLLSAAERAADALHWQTEGKRLTESIRNVFWDERVGLFGAATVCCREHDIWGSAFAVYLGVADANQSQAIATYFQEHYTHIVQHGQIRHLPGGVYWERADCATDTYQNGAYWATPTGWFVYALDFVDPDLADRTIIDLVGDFKEGGACEWIIRDRRQLPHYLASAANPLAGIRAMLERRRSQR